MIDLRLPDRFALEAPSHHNRLHVSFENNEGKTERQGHIIRENPEFPVGIPVRSKGEGAVIYVDYEFRYRDSTDPEALFQTRIHYEIPVEVKENGSDEVKLSEQLPLDELEAV
ncbi:hypothetical protein [Cyclonatronum proteinivorum]|nr:hypothetical protein [Cyclonatronum proteinivorum]